MSFEDWCPYQFFQETMQNQGFDSYDSQMLASHQPCNELLDRMDFRSIEEFLQTPVKLGDPALATLLYLESQSTKSAKHTKDCLKFCRKLSNVVLSQLNTKSKLIQGVLRLNAEALATLVPLLDLKPVDVSELEYFQFQALLRLWRDFKEVLSYHKNKKICVVKQEYWDLIFDKATCTAAYQKIFCGLSDGTKSFAMRSLVKDSIFSSILARLLYSSSKVIALILALRDSSERGLGIRRLSTIDNFIIMMMHPSYISFYNHRAGKFALECCNKCKVCCSKKIPDGFLDILQNSRLQVKEMIANLTHILENSGSNEIGAVASILELAVNNF